jgi:hypothetical protein
LDKADSASASASPGWESRRDNRTGRSYFVDHNSGRTTWEDPRLLTAKEALPNGYEQREDKRTGRIYFVDHKNERTTWDDPREAGIDEGDEPLPQGWERRHTVGGTEYFVDHTTQKTQWERPTEAGSDDFLEPPSMSAMSLQDEARGQPGLYGEEQAEFSAGVRTLASVLCCASSQHCRFLFFFVPQTSPDGDLRTRLQGKV